MEEQKIRRLQITYIVLFIGMFAVIDLFASYITFRAILDEACYVALLAVFSRKYVCVVHQIVEVS